MARLKVVQNYPALRLEKGAVVEFDLTTLRRSAKAYGGPPLSEFVCPEDLVHHSEKAPVVLVEVEVALGPPCTLTIAPNAAERLQTLEEQLSEARARQGAAQSGHKTARANLVEVAERTRIVGADHRAKSDLGLYVHHSREWAAKLVAASADVGRLAIEVEVLRQELEPLPGAPDKLVVLDEEDRARTIDGAELRADLLTQAAVLVQFDGLAERLAEADSPRDGELPFMYPPQAVRALQSLRALLKTWASATGRGTMPIRELSREADVVELIDRAVELVTEARSQRRAETHIEELKTVEV